MPGEVSRVKTPPRGVWGDADAKENVGMGGHNMGGVGGDQGTLRRGKDISYSSRRGEDVGQGGIQLHEIGVRVRVRGGPQARLINLEEAGPMARV